LGVDVYDWTTDGTHGSEVNSITYPMILVGSEGIQAPSQNLVIVNTSDNAVNITFTDNLATNLGISPVFLIEVCVYSSGSGRQYAWATVNNDGSFSYNSPPYSSNGYLPSLAPGEILGYEPTLGTEHVFSGGIATFSALGHIQMAFQVTATPTKGVYSFLENVVGTGSN
jgi:hypothetical protein